MRKCARGTPRSRIARLRARCDVGRRSRLVCPSSYRVKQREPVAAQQSFPGNTSVAQARTLKNCACVITARCCAHVPRLARHDLRLGAVIQDHSGTEPGARPQRDHGARAAAHAADLYRLRRRQCADACCRCNKVVDQTQLRQPSIRAQSLRRESPTPIGHAHFARPDRQRQRQHRLHDVWRGVAAILIDQRRKIAKVVVAKAYRRIVRQTTLCGPPIESRMRAADIGDDPLVAEIDHYVYGTGQVG